MHKSITVARVVRAIKREMTTLDNPGFCTHCGHSAHNCEPDARKDHCEHCRNATVYGAAELLDMIV